MRVDPPRQTDTTGSTPSEPHPDRLPRIQNEEQSEEEQGASEPPDTHDSPDEEEPAVGRPDSGRFEPL